MSFPRLLLYCQHALGLGHLVRSLALAEGLAARFDVVLLNGGRLPPGTTVPAGVDLVNLPPLGYDADCGLVSHDATLSVEECKAVRRRQILEVLDRSRPRVVLIELYPFGRNKFAFELEPLLDAIATGGLDRPRVVCSLRDILVDRRRDQAGHDERVAQRANRHFDAILVHTDPAFARLEDSFRPATPLAVPVRYTGFVVPPTPAVNGPAVVRKRVLISAGGGMVGEPLFRAAVDASERVAQQLGLTTTVVAGPFLPEPCWRWLGDRARRSSVLEALRQVEDLSGEMRRSTFSVSQCGYNTAMDILRAGTPSVVVPFSEGGENEQSRRAGRLAALEAVRVIPADQLHGDSLMGELARLSRFRPRPVSLDLTGRETTSRVIAEIAGLVPARAEPADDEAAT